MMDNKYIHGYFLYIVHVDHVKRLICEGRPHLVKYIH